MRGVGFRRPPSTRAVLLEQLRTVGLSIRWIGGAAIALVGAGTVFAAFELWRGGGSIDFRPHELLLPGIAGLLLPVFVWRDEDHFGSALLWTLPVCRRNHTLLKVAAGWIWLLTGVGTFMVWLLTLSVASGGSVMSVKQVNLLASFQASAVPGVLEPGEWQTVWHAPLPLFWLVPFTAATATYLMASAFVLGLRYPARWLSVGALAVLILRAVSDAASGGWRALGSAAHLLVAGPYGLDAVLTARTDVLKVGTVLATNEPVVVWRGFPDPVEWGVATLLWTVLGAAALWLAASRHRDERPG